MGAAAPCLFGFLPFRFPAIVSVCASRIRPRHFFRHRMEVQSGIFWLHGRRYSLSDACRVSRDFRRMRQRNLPPAFFLCSARFPRPFPCLDFSFTVSIGGERSNYAPRSKGGLRRVAGRVRTYLGRCCTYPLSINTPFFRLCFCV